MKKSNWHGGKGSGRRSSQDDNKYADNWEVIFGNKKINPDKIQWPERTNVNTRTHKDIDNGKDET